MLEVTGTCNAAPRVCGYVSVGVCLCSDSIGRGNYRSCFRVISRAPSLAKMLALVGLKQTQQCELCQLCTHYMPNFSALFP